MADKPLKSLNGKKFAGPLAKPIDTGLIAPLRRRELWDAWIDKHHAELQRQRLAKMPALAAHLGIKFEHLDLTKYSDVVAFYGCIVENLAVREAALAHKYKSETTAAYQRGAKLEKRRSLMDD
jgi:hypothetical protein